MWKAFCVPGPRVKTDRWKEIQVDGWEKKKERERRKEGRKEGGKEIKEKKGRPVRREETFPLEDNTSSTLRRSNFLFVTCEYFNTQEALACGGSVGGQRRVEKSCFLHENHECCLHSLWMPAVNSCHRVTLVYLLEEQPSSNLIAANHEVELLHFTNTFILMPFGLPKINFDQE